MGSLLASGNVASLYPDCITSRCIWLAFRYRWCCSMAYDWIKARAPVTIGVALEVPP
ncbi:hypothetical protein D3C72_2548960 [compost metagenome]